MIHDGIIKSEFRVFRELISTVDKYKNRTTMDLYLYSVFVNRTEQCTVCRPYQCSQTEVEA